MKNENKKILKVLTEEKKRVKIILKLLEKEYPTAQIQLEYISPFELLVATVLSAQCTDKRVNQVTEKLFKKYRNPEDYLKVTQEELEKDIFSTGYYKAKANHIQGSAKAVIEKFNGDVPGTIEELLTLPGVGRKTANVILGHCFKTPGIVVDTHVTRIVNRLGLVNTENAYKIEKELMELFPQKYWVIFTHYLIWHGRMICASRKPKCNKCVLAEYCPSAI